MSVGLYPGSFNPWHVGHQDTLDKALEVFDMVIVLICQNPEKANTEDFEGKYANLRKAVKQPTRTDREVVIASHQGSIISYLDSIKRQWRPKAMIRGLRNGHDLEYEIAQQGLHEDTGNDLPFCCFLTDRKYGHVSSSAIRGLDKLGLEHGYTNI